MASPSVSWSIVWSIVIAVFIIGAISLVAQAALKPKRDGQS